MNPYEAPEGAVLLAARRRCLLPYAIATAVTACLWAAGILILRQFCEITVSGGMIYMTDFPDNGHVYSSGDRQYVTYMSEISVSVAMVAVWVGATLVLANGAVYALRRCFTNRANATGAT